MRSSRSRRVTDDPGGVGHLVEAERRRRGLEASVGVEPADVAVDEDAQHAAGTCRRDGGLEGDQRERGEGSGERRGEVVAHGSTSLFSTRGHASEDGATRSARPGPGPTRVMIGPWPRRGPGTATRPRAAPCCAPRRWPASRRRCWPRATSGWRTTPRRSRCCSASRSRTRPCSSTSSAGPPRSPRPPAGSRTRTTPSAGWPVSTRPRRAWLRARLTSAGVPNHVIDGPTTSATTSTRRHGRSQHPAEYHPAGPRRRSSPRSSPRCFRSWPPSPPPTEPWSSSVIASCGRGGRAARRDRHLAAADPLPPAAAVPLLDGTRSAAYAFQVVAAQTGGDHRAGRRGHAHRPGLPRRRAASRWPGRPPRRGRSATPCPSR